jgi:cyclopropane-fatty-acyl-phospholipid synthase
MTVASFVEDLLGSDLPVAFDAYDGSRAGPDDAPARILIRSPQALLRVVAQAGELGFGRAYAAGELDVEGDIYAALALRDRIPEIKMTTAQRVAGLRLVASAGLHRPPPAPGEARLRGRRHSRARDAAAIAHHYDVSNAFYRLFLGPSMAYTCAVWAGPSVGLEAAQEAKFELVCQKLGLQPGMRLLDVGCGWGGMVLHAATRHGVKAVGVTLSRRQAEWGQGAVAEAGLTGQAEVRAGDYRDVDDGPYDVISSIGLMEHVGSEQMPSYFRHLARLLKPGGRLLNHAIADMPTPGAEGGRWNLRPWAARNKSFLYRFVFPDGELVEVGRTISAMQQAGFEARHMESLREHYALTCRAWVANLERNWDAAVAEADAARARIWRLYMAASALSFEAGATNLCQVLGVLPEDGRSGLPLRPVFERTPEGAPVA